MTSCDDGLRRAGDEVTCPATPATACGAGCGAGGRPGWPPARWWWRDRRHRGVRRGLRTATTRWRCRADRDADCPGSDLGAPPAPPLRRWDAARSGTLVVRPHRRAGLAAAPGEPAVGRTFPVTVWTGEELIVWSGEEGSESERPASGAAYDPAAGRGAPIADSPFGGRAEATAVWTGAEMLVWGASFTDTPTTSDRAGLRPGGRQRGASFRRRRSRPPSSRRRCGLARRWSSSEARAAAA